MVPPDSESGLQSKGRPVFRANEPTTGPDIYFDDPEPEERLLPDARDMVIRIAQACKGNAKLFALVVARMGGLSYQEVADKMGITKPAVYKMVRRLPESVRVLMVNAPFSDDAWQEVWRNIPLKKRRNGKNGGKK